MYEFPEKKTSGRQAPLPDNLRAGLETLSNRSMEGVTVNYDSPVPAQVGALAVTQGKNIFLGPGQEQHLAHEGWHAAQQMDGRVQGTTTVAGLAVNDQQHLEHEADRMGAEALRIGGSPHALQRMTDDEEEKKLKP